MRVGQQQRVDEGTDHSAAPESVRCDDRERCEDRVCSVVRSEGREFKWNSEGTGFITE